MRGLKKVFGAVVLGAVGFVAGSFAANLYVPNLADEFTSQCGQDYAAAIQQADPNSFKTWDDFLMKDQYPCSEAMVTDLAKGAAGALGLGLVGVVAGATLFGRRKNEAPKPV